MKYRFVVVGGGVYGCATAWQLARRGASAVVLEAGDVGSGASGGFGKRGIRADRRAPSELHLMPEAYRLWPRLADDIGAGTGYERTGGLSLVEPDAHPRALAGLQRRAADQQRAGVPSVVLNGADVRVREPAVAQAVQAAMWCPLDGVADHAATTRGLADAARRAGAAVHERRAVRGLVRDGDRVTAVLLDDDQQIGVGDAVVLASNTGAGDMVATHLGVTLPVERMFPQALVVKTSSAAVRGHLIGHDHRTLALKRLGDDQIMVTGGWRGRWGAAQQSGQLVPQAIEGNLAEARAVYPTLEDAVVDRADASRPESRSSDGLPIIDTMPTATNVVVATGWTGHGFAIAPVVAALLAEWLITGSRPGSLIPFRLRRFAASDVPTTQVPTTQKEA